MSLTLTDATSPTPVNRVFNGTQSDPSLTIWKDLTTNGGQSVGAGVASLSVKENGNGTHRIVGKLVIPEMEVPDGDDSAGFEPAPTVAYEDLSTFELVFPARASLQSRKNQLAMLKDFLADAKVTDAVENFVHPTP